MIIPKTLEQLVVEIEKLYAIGPESITGMSPTGESFVVISSGGPKTEGECHHVFADTKQKAVELLWYEFLKYAQSKKDSILYWRQKPEITELKFLLMQDMEGVDPHGYPTIPVHFLYFGRMRLLLSSKPQLPENEIE